ncbi:DUF167 family protein [Methylocella sp.]|uniref:DUF167 family protein n=1 Tax=Methylocella sp. TaxID=1978226 RepID=UPI003C1565A7
MTAGAASDSAPLPWSLRGGALVLSVRLTPKSARDEIGAVDHLSDGRAVLKARVRAAPQDGEANAALIKLIAKTLRIPATAIRLEFGATARVKTLVLKGDAQALEAALVCAAGLRG